MNIAKNTVVTLHYKLQRESAAGDLIEQTYGSDPLVFLYGAGNMIPAFEAELADKAAGDEFAFGIKSSDAYGEVNPEAVVDVPISTFIIEGQLAEDLLEIGKMIPMRDQSGNQMVGTVKAVDRDGGQVTLDFNHPMAGVDLYFTGQVEEVRKATDTEVEHGHVHGEGGHEH